MQSCTCTVGETKSPQPQQRETTLKPHGRNDEITKSRNPQCISKLENIEAARGVKTFLPSLRKDKRFKASRAAEPLYCRWPHCCGFGVVDGAETRCEDRAKVLGCCQFSGFFLFDQWKPVRRHMRRKKPRMVIPEPEFWSRDQMGHMPHARGAVIVFHNTWQLPF